MKKDKSYRWLLAVLLILQGNFVFGDEVATADFTGQKYQLLRDTFIKQGWLPDAEHTDPKVYPEFPEISCGAGKDAICSAGFKLGSRYEAIIIEEKGGELIVAGSY